MTVDRITPYQEIDRLLTKHRISGMPVLKMGREVVGVVSETDLLAAEDETHRQARMASSMGRRWHLRKQPHERLTAGALMTSPAITIGPDATIPGAARLMNTHHITRLPVIDENGKLVGIVGRRDLLSVFLRPDADVAHDARQVLDELSLADPKEVIAEVRHGVVTLTGMMRPEAGPRAGPDVARAPADLGHRRRGRRGEPARRGEGGQDRLTRRSREGRGRRPFLRGTGSRRADKHARQLRDRLRLLQGLRSVRRMPLRRRRDGTRTILKVRIPPRHHRPRRFT